MNILKNLIFILLMFILMASAIQYEYPLKEEPLKGFYQSKEKPYLKYFTWERWFSGDFQSQTMDRLDENVGFRNSLIRIFHQYDYSFFGIQHTNGFLEGKERWFYEEDYIHEYTGRFFIGKEVIDRKLNLLKRVSDILRSHGIPLILVYESGKASLYPEYIPDHFHPEKRTLTNYEYFRKRSEQMGIPFLDLSPVLKKMKDTSDFPVFPKYGMHWSLYATHYMADTLARFVQNQTGIAMPRFPLKSVQYSSHSIESDYDIAELLNLICPLPKTPNAYPIVPFAAVPDGKSNALIIADSYYILLAETYGRKMFGKQDYWYYNNSLYPFQNEVPPRKIDKTNLREKLLGYDIILLMVSDLNLHSGFWNFADEAWLAFHPWERDSHLDRIENSMRNDDEWFRFMVEKSEKQHRPLQEVIQADAAFMFYSNFAGLENKNFMDSIQYIRIGIKMNPDWYAKVKKKALDLNIPVDSMLFLDAAYTYEQTRKIQ